MTNGRAASHFDCEVDVHRNALLTSTRAVALVCTATAAAVDGKKRASRL